MAEFRIEHDSLGKLRVPIDALYAAQTQRAIENFPISGLTLPIPFLQALALVKRTAAITNRELQLLAREKAAGIIAACDEIIDGQHLAQFPVDVFQTGSGTSTNMNANEVIATLATKKSGEEVRPNDDVNMGQSSNDVIPTVIHVSAAIELHQKLLPALHHLQDVIVAKAATLENQLKTGRTHLMDAMPIRMSQELSGWAAQIAQATQGLESAGMALYGLAQGATAVGTGINAHVDFARLFAKELSRTTGLPFHPSTNFFASLGSQDVAVALSGQLKTLAVALMKIANDLRWMNSGPLAGLAEIELQALQPGSSIMPGKVNPVIPEAVAMVAAQVIGNDLTITLAGQSGNFELNVMLPVLAYNLLQSIQLLSSGARQLADKAIATFTVNETNLQKALAHNPILITALTPIIGYTKAAEIAKKAYLEARPVIEVAAENTNLSLNELKRLLDPERLTQGGIQR